MPPPFTRRDVLKTAAAVTALGAARLELGPQPASAASADPSRPVSMAMHIHSSWSEGIGSMQSPMEEATASGLDVIWWTDHDFRMAEHGFPGTIHLDGPSEPVPELDCDVTWATVHEGSLATGTVAWDKQMASPADSATPGSVHLTARSTGEDWAAIRISGDATRTVLHRNLYDQTINVDVFPSTVSPNAYLAVKITTSYRPTTAGRPAGQYTLTYIVDGTQNRARIRHGIDAVVHLPARTGEWATLDIHPQDDIASFWPDLDSHDAAMTDITLGAVSREEYVADGWFDFFRITRPPRGADDVFAVQRAVMQGYSVQFPAVRQYQGTEVSLLNHHFNWFGPEVHMPTFDLPGAENDRSLPDTLAIVDWIHSLGALASYNHPYGTSQPPLLSSAQQDQMRAQQAKVVFNDNALNCDIIEVGYPSRAGVDLDHHAQLWDFCSRNAMFLTGNAVSDDHSGKGWGQQTNRWVTWAHAPSREMADLQAALSSGQVFFADLFAFNGTLDLLVDGYAPMGSVTVSSASTRTVRIILTSPPAGSSVRIVTGAVDMAGLAQPEPNVTFTEASARAWATTGYVDIPVDTTAPRFVRFEVRDSTGAPLALSNPVWLLRDHPPGGIPAPRSVT